MKDQCPPFLNSQTLNVLVKPAGPRHRAKRSGWLIAAKTCSMVTAISRDALNVVVGLLSRWLLTGFLRLSFAPAWSQEPVGRAAQLGPGPECGARVGHKFTPGVPYSFYANKGRKSDAAQSDGRRFGDRGADR